MKAALYSPYLDTLGGGEKYIATIAELLSQKGFEAVFFWDDPKIIKSLSSRFNLELQKVKVLPNIFKKSGGFLKKWRILHSYDFSFFLSDGSVPMPLAKNNFLHFQVPFVFKNVKNPANKVKFSRYQGIICNSNFTKKYIDQTFGINSQIVYPPVDLPLARNLKKENIILSVGRFFDFLHSKKQEVLIEVFKKMVGDGFSGWQLFLAGGVINKKYFLELESIAKGYPIKFFPDLSYGELKSLYSKAKIFWHAAGFGQDLESHPEKAEHFGISIVEAMAAGCVPVVFGAGGAFEIIDEGKNGLFWSDLSKLESHTLNLVNDQNRCQEVSSRAVQKSKEFSKAKFKENISQTMAISLK